MIYTGDSMQNMCLTVDCNDITDKELQELQEVLKNYCCSICGYDLQLLRIPAEKEADERLELYCAGCNRFDAGMDKEAYKNTVVLLANMTMHTI